MRTVNIPLTKRVYDAYMEDITEAIQLTDVDEKRQELKGRKYRIEKLYEKITGVKNDRRTRSTKAAN